MSDKHQEDLQALIAAALSSAASLCPIEPKPTGILDVGTAEWRQRRLIRDQHRLVRLALGQIQGDQSRGSREFISVLEARIAELEQALQCSREDCIDLQRKVEHEALKPTSRRSLERLLVVALITAYGTKPGTEKRSESLAVRRGHDADLLGIKIDPKTIRKHVNAAAERLPEE